MPDSLNELGILLAAFLPNLILALVVLVVGWLVALLISRLVENMLHRTTLDERVAGMLRGGQPSSLPMERWISRAVFWLIMVFVLLIFLQMLNLGAISQPINAMLTDVLDFLPNLLAAAVLVLLAWVIATVLRLVITRLLSGGWVSQRLSEDAAVDPRNRIGIGQTIGNVVYWLVFLLFLPAILDALDLQGILAPVQGMVDSILGALPNIFGAVVILAVGWLVARVVRQIVGNLLAGVGVDRLGGQTGVNNALGNTRLSDVIATIVFVLILIPVVTAALNVLDIPAISQPAANMLDRVLNALPAIFGAFLILAIAYFIARLVGSLVSNILNSIGFDRIFTETGLMPSGGISLPRARADGTVVEPSDASMEVSTTRTKPSDVVGWVVMISILLFAAMEASNMLGFEALTVMMGEFIVTAWNILFGLIIFGLGLWLSSVAYRMIRNTGSTNAHILATAARVAIVIFSGALALRQMGIAEDIVNLAFGLLLGAVAVAAALAFGLGGRNVAADVLERWRGQLREEANKPTPPIPQTGVNRSTTTPSTGQTSTIARPGDPDLPTG